MKFSEYVSLGHPDKMADYISEYILDRIIEQDRNVRYALEVQVKDNNITLAGEVTTTAHTNYDVWVRDAICQIGYTEEYAARWGNENVINPELISINKYISQQSSDISRGVDNNGWGDQGIMFGMAVNNPQTGYMPEDHFLAKKICTNLYDSKIAGLDIKTQVVFNGCAVKKVIVAIPMMEDVTDKVTEIVRDTINGNYDLIINGTGRYIKHSSMGDCGTTGRKLVVDFYGGNCNIGGGAPWTKDGTKADLTLNLYARKVALDYVINNGVNYAKCGIECSIGSKSITVAIWNEINNLLHSEVLDIAPIDLIGKFRLDEPIYADLCRYGLFSNLK